MKLEKQLTKSIERPAIMSIENKMPPISSEINHYKQMKQ